MNSFFNAAFYGLIAGMFFELGYFFRFICKFNKIITILIDVLVTTIGGFLFIFCAFIIGDGIIRIYDCIAFFLGFGIERISIGILFANLWALIYNRIIKNLREPKERACPVPNSHD